MKALGRRIAAVDARLGELRDADADTAGFCTELVKISGAGELTAMLACVRRKLFAHRDNVAARWLRERAAAGRQPAPATP